MKPDKKKYMLARARACMDRKTLKRQGYPKGRFAELSEEAICGQRRQERLPRHWELM